MTRATRTGFNLKLSRPIEVGDVLRVQPQSGDEGPAVTVTRLSVARKNGIAARFPSNWSTTRIQSARQPKGLLVGRETVPRFS